MGMTRERDPHIPQGGFIPLPEHPLHDQDVWIKARVSVHMMGDGMPIVRVGRPGFEIFELEDFEYKFVD